MLTISMAVIINSDCFQTGFLDTPPVSHWSEKRSSSLNSHLFSVTSVFDFMQSQPLAVGGGGNLKTQRREVGLFLLPV